MSKAFESEYLTHIAARSLATYAKFSVGQAEGPMKRDADRLGME